MDVQIVSDHREPGSIEHATYILRVDPRDMAEALEANAAGRNFDLDFPGGTMKEFVHTLRDVADANILLRPEANDVQVPELMLRGADVHNLMVTMSGRLQAPEGARGELDIDWTTTDGAERLLYVVEIESASDAAERRAPRVHHWALGAITEETPVTAEDVLGAIEVAQEFFESEVIVRYHEPTRTLIAKGLESDLEVIDQLIDRIEGSAVFLDQDE
jgi:hypothetical protein